LGDGCSAEWRVEQALGLVPALVIEPAKKRKLEIEKISTQADLDYTGELQETAVRVDSVECLRRKLLYL